MRQPGIAAVFVSLLAVLTAVLSADASAGSVRTAGTVAALLLVAVAGALLAIALLRGKQPGDGRQANSE